LKKDIVGGVLPWSWSANMAEMPKGNGEGPNGGTRRVNYALRVRSEKD